MSIKLYDVEVTEHIKHIFSVGAEDEEDARLQAEEIVSNREDITEDWDIDIVEITED